MNVRYLNLFLEIPRTRLGMTLTCGQQLYYAMFNHPTAPSSDTLSNFCASTANSIGSLLSTSRA